jgi:hypothetical protein
MRALTVLSLILLSFGFLHCGSGGTSETIVESINTEKLVSTPFEGMTTGDDFKYWTFLCDDYATEVIDQLPIPIFAAFFTPSEEAVIQEGIDIANEAMGFEAYVLTDTWSDDARVIYKVDTIDGDRSAIGHTNARDRAYNSRSFAENVVFDWVIELEQSGTDKWTVAHELGHASGITSHKLIDYDNIALLPLEPNSVMSPTEIRNPVLNDYNYMMTIQGQYFYDHMGDYGDPTYDPGTRCETLKSLYP